MRNPLLWLSICLTLFSLNVFSQDIDDYAIHLRKEVIRVLDTDSGFISHVEYFGQTGEKGGKAYVYKNGVAEIEELKVGFFKKRNQLKNIRRIKIEDLSYTSGFWSDERIYVFDLPENKNFKYDYILKNKEIPFLSALRFGVYDADTQIFIVQIPSNLNMKYLVEDTASLTFFELKITTTDAYTEYLFKGIIDTTKKSTQSSSQRYTDLLSVKQDPYPSVRLIVTPKEFAGSENQFVNQWISNLIKPSENISPETAAIIDETIGETNDQDSIIQKVYNMVKNKIRYVNMYTGLGGYQPHEVDYIITQKQGDCKDMANLTCQALRHAGIEANLAISATLSHPFEMNFPTLTSGNHMICVTKDKAGNQLFLDPTETQGVYYHPSRQIQGTRVFVVGEEKGFFMDVPAVSADQNNTALRYDLTIDNKKLVGTFNFEFNSIEAIQIKTWYNEYTQTQFNAAFTSFLNQISPRINYKAYEVEDGENSIIVSGLVEIPKSAYTLVGDKKYLLINFLPFPHPYTNRVKDSTHYLTYSAINNQVDVFFYTETTISEITDLTTQMSEDPIIFEFTTTAEDQVLHIHYQYRYDDIEIEKNFSSKFNQFDKSIKDIFSKVVIFK